MFCFVDAMQYEILYYMGLYYNKNWLHLATQLVIHYFYEDNNHESAPCMHETGYYGRVHFMSLFHFD